MAEENSRMAPKYELKPEFGLISVDVSELILELRPLQAAWNISVWRRADEQLFTFVHKTDEFWLKEGYLKEIVRTACPQLKSKESAIVVSELRGVLSDMGYEIETRAGFYRKAQDSRKTNANDKENKSQPIIEFGFSKNILHPALDCKPELNLFTFGVSLWTKEPICDREGNSLGEKNARRLFIIDNSRRIAKVQNDQVQLGEFVFEVAGDLEYRQIRGWSPCCIEQYLKGERKAKPKRETFELVKTQYKTYLEFTKAPEYTFHAIWDIGTYFHQLFNAYPYEHIFGLKGTGKSKKQDLSAQIAFNAHKSGNPSGAVIYRLGQQNRATLILDEMENLERSEHKQDIVELLNNGYKKGNPATRIEKEGDRFVTKTFETYSPKSIANIKGLTDTLEHRSITTVMQRARRGDPRSELYPSESDEIWQSIRDECYLLAFENWNEVLMIYKTLPKEVSFGNREWEIWKPILSMAKFFGEDIYQEMRAFAEDSYCEDDELGADWDSKLADYLISTPKYDEDDFYDVKDITVDFCKEFEENEMKPSSKWLGKALKRLGFERLKKRTSNRRMYHLSRKIVNSILGRYMPSRVKPDDDTGEGPLMSSVAQSEAQNPTNSTPSGDFQPSKNSDNITNS